MSAVTSERFDGSSFRAGLYLQGRVIAALTYRELQTRFGKMKFGIIWTLLEPFVYAMSLVKMREFVSPTSALVMGESLEIFYLTGFLPYLFFRNMSGKVMNAISANRAILQLILVTNLDVIFARIILETCIFMIAIVAWFIVLGAMGLQYWPAYPVMFIMAFAAVALLGAGFGTIDAVVSVLFPWYRKLAPWITRALFLTSGAIFPIANRFPPDIVAIFSWNPLLHCVEWMRGAFIANYRPALLDQSYVVFAGALLLLFGLLLERAFRRRLSVEQ